MRIASSVTSISWIPSEAVEGLPKLPFTFGVAHYDDPPPDRIDHIETMHRADLFREANELKAWIEVDDSGKIVDHGHGGQGRIGLTRLKLGPKEIAVPAVAMPTLQNSEVGDGWVRFTQTAGGRTGMPAPRAVRRPPFVQFVAPIAWRPLELVLHADGRAEVTLVGASPFPRHWIYDGTGALAAKSRMTNFKGWAGRAFGAHPPWGDEESTALVTAVETALERQLSNVIMRGGPKPEIRRLREGDLLTEQGEHGDELFLLLDGVLAVEVDGDPLAEVGPGAVLGERAVLEG